MSRLYIVATPIGNLKDITLRALEILKEVDFIACEDTRHSRRLFTAHGIAKPLVSCHAPMEESGAGRVVGLLGEGKTGAYVSDAGTPGISDPGSLLVRRVRDAGHEIIPIPGPSAASALVSVSGFRGKGFRFEGYLSPKAGRRRSRLAELLDSEESVLLYESPYRIVKLMRDIADMYPEREVLIGREMTKMHEEYVEMPAAAAADMLESRSVIKGEFAVLVAGNKKV